MRTAIQIVNNDGSVVCYESSNYGEVTPDLDIAVNPSENAYYLLVVDDFGVPEGVTIPGYVCTYDSSEGDWHYFALTPFGELFPSGKTVSFSGGTWFLEVSEDPPEGMTLDADPVGEIESSEESTISWTSETPTRPYAMRNGVLDETWVPASSTNGEATIGGQPGDNVAVGLQGVAIASLPTHFRAVWMFDAENFVDYGGTTGVTRVNGSIEPFVVGSVSKSEGAVQISTTTGYADMCFIEFFASDEATHVPFRGNVKWQTDLFPPGAYWSDGELYTPLEFKAVHRSRAYGSGNYQGRKHNFDNVYAAPNLTWKITEIEADQPYDTVQPEAPDPITDGGGGASWPEEPDPEVEPPPEPEGGPWPVPPPEGGTRPETTIECVCAVFLLYIGDWIQNVSINIWNLCQYVFQITQSIGTWIGYLARVLQSGLSWIGDSLDNMLTYFEYFLEEMRRGNDALEGIQKALEDIRDKPPIDVVVADDEVMVHGIEQEEDLPEVWLRRGIK